MVNSFDQTVGIIGGYAGLIWMTVSFFIGGYQQFKMDSSIAKTLYTRQDEHPPEARSEEEMLDDHYLVGKSTAESSTSTLTRRVRGLGS